MTRAATAVARNSYLQRHGRDRGVAPIQLAVRGETCELAGAGTQAFQLGLSRRS